MFLSTQPAQRYGGLFSHDTVFVHRTVSCTGRTPVPPVSVETEQE